jgi:lipoprotein NlpD
VVVGVAKGRAGLLAVVALLAAASCGRSRTARRPAAAKRDGIVHVVQRGETLYRIGEAYGLPYQELARVNRLRDPSKIHPGQRLFVPGARQPRPAPAVVPVKAMARAPRLEPRDPHAPPFRWPLPNGMVTSGFGPRGTSFHDGIDIAAPAGAPVRAAAGGEVVFSDALPGYGNLVILRHERHYVTVYAHNERNHVHEGQRVAAGDLIATVGRTGRATGPNLHFEVRRHHIVRNPLLFLPAPQRARAVGGGVRVVADR